MSFLLNQDGHILVSILEWEENLIDEDSKNIPRIRAVGEVIIGTYLIGKTHVCRKRR
ncbi:hypothetical protein Q9306_02880 [Bacillus sp. WLY-B-L8]|nr:hypothetical protein [Bacillus sp. WLY-B-L8]